MKDTPKIDFVVPYVNNQDKIWRAAYIKFCQENNLKDRIIDLIGSRYGGLTYIYYQLQLVSKNMPWINKIFLLVSNKEQIIPSLLPKNCVVVLHEEFIPFSFRPTFNSTTIEMFLWNIPKLGEYFIYANDDMLPTGKLEPKDFFENGKIKISWREQEWNARSNIYSYQCRNGQMAIIKRLKAEYDTSLVLKPLHSFTPMIKSHCVEAYKLIKDLVVPHIRAFRTMYQYNQYIYPLYERFKYGYIESDIDFLYTELEEDFNLNHQIVCVNLEKSKEFVNKFLTEIKKICE